MRIKLKPRFIWCLHQPLKPACGGTGAVPRTELLLSSGHSCIEKHWCSRFLVHSVYKRQMSFNLLFKILSLNLSVCLCFPLANTSTLLAPPLFLKLCVTFLSLAAPLYLQWQYPGWCLLHANSVERPAHLLVRQHGRRQVHWQQRQSNNRNNNLLLSPFSQGHWNTFWILFSNGTVIIFWHVSFYGKLS